MMTTVHSAVGAEKAAIVRDFYQSLIAGDADGATDLVNEHFADDAKVIRPASLPGGGTITGVDAVAKFVGAAAKSAVAMSVERVMLSAAEDQTDVFAALTIDLGGAAMPVLERWTFVADRITRLHAFYFDTAALVRRPK